MVFGKISQPTKKNIWWRFPPQLKPKPRQVIPNPPAESEEKEKESKWAADLFYFFFTCLGPPNGTPMNIYIYSSKKLNIWVFTKKATHKQKGFCAEMFCDNLSVFWNPLLQYTWSTVKGGAPPKEGKNWGNAPKRAISLRVQRKDVIFSSSRQE